MSTKQDPEIHLRAGYKVEISPEGEGFRGSFYRGAVVRRVAAAKKDEAKFLVEYETLTSDEAGTQQLREVVDAIQLRPVAPREVAREFKFSEEVDAYHSDGWWEGVITEELGGGRFAVFFRATREQIEFDQADLRLHREWVAGEWVPPLEGEGVKEEEAYGATEVKSSRAKAEKFPEETFVEEVSGGTEVKSNKAKAEKYPEGAPVEVSSDEDGLQGAWFAAIVVQALKRNKILIEYKSLRTDDDTDFLREAVDNLHIRPHPPETPLVDQFTLLDEVDALYNDGWWIGVVSKVLPGSRYTVYFKNTKEEIEFEHSELRLHQEWMGDKWLITTKALKL